MNKPSNKELLEYFDGMCQFLANHHWTERDERAVAIRELIKNQPEVDEGFINTWANELATATLADKQMHKRLAYMLKEAGVEVVKK